MPARLAGGLLVCSVLAGLGFVSPALAGGSQLVSKRNPSAAQSAAGNGYSAAPSVTPDGRYVLFVSTANNLAAGDNSQLGTDVFVRDRVLNTTTLVSVNMNGTGGGNGNSTADMISADGRYVLFESDASDLVPGDNNGLTDIFLRDLLAGTTALVSVSTNGGSANGASSDGVMTPDGRYVAFLSVAANLVTNDVNGIQDVFVRDLVAGTTTLVSVGATTSAKVPIMDTPVITPDGRYVAFFSFASGLVSGLSQFPGDIYVRDLIAGTTVMVSTNLTSGRSTFSPIPSGATHPVLSDDGRYIAFKCPTNSQLPVLRYDSVTGSNTLVVADSYPLVTYGNDLDGPEMSPDGRYIVYVADTVFGGVGYSSVHLWDGQSATDTLVSVATDSSFPTNTFSDTPALSPDGRYVAFLSTATNLVTNVVAAGTHVYLRDMQAGVTELIDVDTNGTGSVNCISTIPSLSTNGQSVAFTAPDGGLVALDNNLALDVFLRNRTNSTTELISARNPALPNQSGGGISLVSQTALSSDGRWLVFTSRSEDLVTNDFNTDSDVFVADLLVGTNVLVSVATNGNSGLGGASTSPVMSTNGRYVAFLSAATNLVTNDTILANKVFYRDLQAGTNVLGSAYSNGLSVGTGDCQAPAMSQDGRYLAFVCKTNASSSTSLGVFWRDMSTGQTILLASNASSATGPSLSADGRYACYNYFDGSSHLVVWDMQTATVVYSNTTPFSGTIVLGGTRMVTGQTLVDFVSHATLFTFPNNITSVQWSSDGRYFAYATSSSGGPWDNNLASDVFLLDLQTSTTTLVSANSNRTATANSSSDSPVLSGDGRFVVFRSYATNILPGTTNVPNLYVFDRFTGSNTLLTAEPPGSSWSSWVSKPAVNGNGAVIAFSSVRPGLVPGSLDLNRTPDVFTAPPPWPPTDSVGDGISDAWRAAYFGGNGTTTNTQSCATCDPDGDGISNLQEYLAGTSPINSASGLRLQLSSLVAGGSVVLSWPSVPGKSYQVQYKNNLADPSWTTLAGTMTVIGYQWSFTVSAPLPGRYYQVVVVN